MRRRRRRGTGLSPRHLMIAGGVALAAFVGGFFYVLNVADNADPAREEVRVPVADAFAPKQP